jgi:hypothetical protein
MKKLLLSSVLFGLIATLATLNAQEQKDDYLGLPGDNLNLYAVMNLFRDSKTLEEFEKNLNDENFRINNLDLNGDTRVDYISVFDNIDGNVHNIVLQVAINNREKQDVAVFTVERDNNGNVLVQLIGDEELYGKNYIIEPIFDEANNGQTPNPGYAGNQSTVNGRNITIERTTTVEIAAWPVVRFIYMPNYVSWHSSWYWDYYPSYWNPWQPFYWDYYYGYHCNWYNDYYGHYRRWDHPRYSRWNDYYYTPMRSHSTYVNVNIQNGRYKTTYSHPEQRKDGEELYKRDTRDQNNRRTDNSAGSNQNRRSESGTQVNTNHRSTTTETNRSATNPAREVKTGTNRRAETKTTRKSTVNPSQTKAKGATRRAQTKAAEKPATSTRPSVESKPAKVTTRERKSTRTSTQKAEPAAKKEVKETTTKKENRR